MNINKLEKSFKYKVFRVFDKKVDFFYTKELTNKKQGFKMIL